jgi:hypothetical protein
MLSHPASIPLVPFLPLRICLSIIVSPPLPLLLCICTQTFDHTVIHGTEFLRSGVHQRTVDQSCNGRDVLVHALCEEALLDIPNGSNCQGNLAIGRVKVRQSKLG